MAGALFHGAVCQRTARPAAVLVHGGSFETGSSTSDDEPVLAQNLVARGYVAGEGSFVHLGV